MKTLLLLLILFVSTDAAGQLSEKSKARIRDEVTAERTDSLDRHLTVRPPTVPLFGTAPAGFASVGPGEQKSTLTASGGFHLVDVGLPSFTAKLEATTPVTEGSKDPVTFGSLKGLGNGTNLSLSFTGSSRGGSPPTRPSELMEWCKAKKQQQPDPLAGITDCNQIDITIIEADEAAYREYLRISDWREAWLFDLTGTIARSDNKHLDPTTFQPAKLDRVSWSAGFNVGRFWHASLWSGGLGYKLNYKAQDKAEICAPLPGDALQCREAPLGPPDRQTGFVVNVQNRRFISRHVGFNPIVSYDFAEDGIKIETPLYFVRDSSGSLVGGIGPAYQSRGDDKWSLRLFVGSALKFKL